MQTAIALDNELADAYSNLGVIAARHEYDWVAANRHLRHALELNPSSALAHYHLAQNVLAPQGRWQEAKAEGRLASELDPLSQLNAATEPWLAYLEGRHEAAAEGFRSLLVSSPANMMASVGLASALSGKGDYAGALKIMEQQQRTAPSPRNLAFMGMNLARQGNLAAARKILQQLLESSRRGQFVAPSTLMVVYMGLGDAGNVFHYAEISRKQQESSLIFTRVGSNWAPFRSDPRYLTLLREIGLSDDQVKKNQLVNENVHRLIHLLDTPSQPKR